MENEAVPLDEAQIDEVAVHTLKPFENPADNGNGDKMGPYDIQAQLQDKMQELVGIARSQESLTQALEEIQNLREKAENVHDPSVTANITPDGTPHLTSTAYSRFLRRLRLRH